MINFILPGIICFSASATFNYTHNPYKPNAEKEEILRARAQFKALIGLARIPQDGNIQHAQRALEIGQRQQNMHNISRAQIALRNANRGLTGTVASRGCATSGGQAG